MRSDFDDAALTYDEDFTYSLIGTCQRRQVWNYLDKAVSTDRKIRILELNCGTGEDAIRFGKQGHQVLATDISEGMLRAAQAKNRELAVSFRKLDLNEIENFEVDEPYDVVFSNFGGLNCLTPEAIGNLGKKISEILKPEGKYIAVVMPSFCFWESAFFLLKIQWKKVFRRQAEFVSANVSGQQVKTFYFSPAKFRKLNPDSFRLELLKPIGLYVPPSYLEKFMRKRPYVLSALQSMDHLLARFGWQAYLSDHYYIQFSNS